MPPPYSTIAPRTTSINELTANLERIKETYGRSSSQALEAYLHLSREATRQGRPLHQLRTHVDDEVERFFAWTIPGLDGHTYWDGPANFTRNDGAKRQPRRWWWEHRYGPLKDEPVIAICGERNCVTPEHCEAVIRTQRTKRMTDEQMLGAIQVWSIQNGKIPTRHAWALSDPPAGLASSTIMLRFGSWNLALRAAGLEIWEPRGVTTAMCLRAIRLARSILNRWPSAYDLQQPEIREKLRQAGLPQQSTIRARLGGTWSEALRKAGKR